MRRPSQTAVAAERRKMQVESAIRAGRTMRVSTSNSASDGTVNAAFARSLVERGSATYVNGGAEIVSVA